MVLAFTANVVYKKSFRSIPPCEKIQPKLIDAVSIRIPQDDRLKWGVLLSGGLDSSLIAAIAADAVHPKPLYTFTIAFSNQDFGAESVTPTNSLQGLSLSVERILFTERLHLISKMV